MNIAALVDDEAMRHLSMFGCVKNMEPFALHMLKHSQEPILRFRRDWMRRTALRQHLDSEKRQQKINDQFRHEPYRKSASMRKAAVIDPHLAAESLHYNQGASWNDRKFLGAVRAEAPAIFPQREAV
jgi:hypothetical protein